jgi:hypothetical protein
MNVNWIKGAALLLLLMGGVSLHAQAALNEQVRFQGRLTNPGGTPITTATNVQFRIYTQPTGGAPVWQETQAVVPSASGVFTAQLGAVTAYTGEDFSQVL